MFYYIYLKEMLMYELRTKDGETLNKKSAESMEDAIELFSKYKMISSKSLLDIFDVVYVS